LQKPISALNAQTLSQRRDQFMTRAPALFRHPVEMSATISFGEARSQGNADQYQRGRNGHSLRSPLPKSAVSTASFKLPGTATPLEPKVQIAWMDESVAPVCASCDVPKESRAQLDAWCRAVAKKMGPASG